MSKKDFSKNQLSEPSHEDGKVSPAADLNKDQPKNPGGRMRAWGRRAYQRYLIDALGAMAFGLFASLLTGIIINQLFGLVPWAPIQKIAALISQYTNAASPVVGASIGVAIAYSLKVKPLVIYSCAAVGAIGYSVSSGGVSAGPVGAIIAVIVAAELASLVVGRTSLDIILVPATALISGSIVALLVGPPMAGFMLGLGDFINRMTLLQPFGMGISIAVVMAIVILSPISSAALAIMLGLGGIAAGAATVGCAASMVGFAVASYRENRWGGLLTMGIGTSKLQLTNSIKHPVVVIPALAAAAICGPIATVFFGIENIAYGAGMGTSGLVGPLTTWSTMETNTNSGELLLKIVLIYFVFPAVIAIVTSEIMRRKQWIQSGWMKIDVK